MVEIGKALSRNARVIAFDEPTSSLSLRETGNLMVVSQGAEGPGLRRHLRESSHGGDLVGLDRVTVFRDGRRVAAFDMNPAPARGALLQALVGRPLDDIYDHRPRQPGALRLEVSGVAGRGLQQPAVSPHGRGRSSDSSASSGPAAPS